MASFRRSSRAASSPSSPSASSSSCRSGPGTSSSSSCSSSRRSSRKAGAPAPSSGRRRTCRDGAPTSSTRTAPIARSSRTACIAEEQHNKLTDPIDQHDWMVNSLARSQGAITVQADQRPRLPRHGRLDRAVRRPVRHRRRHHPRADPDRRGRPGFDRRGRRPGRRGADHDRASASPSRCRRSCSTTG